MGLDNQILHVNDCNDTLRNCNKKVMYIDDNKYVTDMDKLKDEEEFGVDSYEKIIGRKRYNDNKPTFGDKQVFVEQNQDINRQGYKIVIIDDNRYVIQKSSAYNGYE